MSALQGSVALVEPIQIQAPAPRWICLTEEVGGHGGDLNWRLSQEDEGEEKGGEDEMKGEVDKGRADRVKGMDRKGSRENVKDKGRQRERERGM